MKILTEFKPVEKLPLPKGKLNARHRQMRGVWQIFAGSLYINGASGDSPQEAAEELARQYDVALGTMIKVNGLGFAYTILTTEP